MLYVAKVYTRAQRVLEEPDSVKVYKHHSYINFKLEVPCFFEVSGSENKENSL